MNYCYRPGRPQIDYVVQCTVWNSWAAIQRYRQVICYSVPGPHIKLACNTKAMCSSFTGTRCTLRSNITLIGTGTIVDSKETGRYQVGTEFAQCKKSQIYVHYFRKQIIISIRNPEPTQYGMFTLLKGLVTFIIPLTSVGDPEPHTLALIVVNRTQIRECKNDPK